ncbi:GNAT family N-acetyltransferase [Streptomyces sp. TRM66268-LWL]|uniref:GNAT family N-acetyltransferase n=1 Tax=Streptomyces polyasparticus TaxID=2767826 RepID=A0ABR7SX71_9ACTN|nr:GNAT family N-acetyltransferase [Streptomyces polyasparticus]MBC9719126.1 GNAT family N-acetyltransferase [Streptomyces polyasparticus]
MSYEIRAVRADEWEQVRDLRLQALQDPAAPIAYLETYEAANARPDQFWQDRAAGHSHGLDGRQFVAVDEHGIWVGATVSIIEHAGREDFFGVVLPVTGAHFVGVYVDPEHRGRGLVQRLFEAAAEWSWTVEGVERARLFVHQDNHRAQAAYKKIGFERSGGVVPLESDPSKLEYEMVLAKP